MPSHCCFHLHLLIIGKHKFNIFYRFIPAICFILMNCPFMFAYFSSLVFMFSSLFSKNLQLIFNSVSTFQLYVILQKTFSPNKQGMTGKKLRPELGYQDKSETMRKNYCLPKVSLASSLRLV